MCLRMWFPVPVLCGGQKLINPLIPNSAKHYVVWFTGLQIFPSLAFPYSRLRPNYYLQFFSNQLKGPTSGTKWQRPCSTMHLQVRFNRKYWYQMKGGGPIFCRFYNWFTFCLQSTTKILTKSTSTYKSLNLQSTFSTKCFKIP